jgi:hypothetical protein
VQNPVGRCDDFRTQSAVRIGWHRPSLGITVLHKNDTRKPDWDIVYHMKVEAIAEAVSKLPPDQLARFRRWFTAFEAGRANHAEELDSAATKLGRIAGRAFAELKRRGKQP